VQQQPQDVVLDTSCCSALESADGEPQNFIGFSLVCVFISLVLPHLMICTLPAVAFSASVSELK